MRRPAKASTFFGSSWVCWSPWPECFGDPMEMMAWWKAVVPGEFRMGSEEYWESAQRGEETLPPQDGQLSGNDLLHMDKLMPGWAKALM